MRGVHAVLPLDFLKSGRSVSRDFLRRVCVNQRHHPVRPVSSDRLCQQGDRIFPERQSGPDQQALHGPVCHNGKCGFVLPVQRTVKIIGVICEMWVTKERVARNVQNERPVFLKGIDCHDHVDSPVRFAISTHLQRYKYLPVQQLNYQSY